MTRRAAVGLTTAALRHATGRPRVERRGSLGFRRPFHHHGHLGDHGRERARLDFTSVSIADLRPSPSAAIGAREDLRLLLSALRQIPLELQVLLELYYWERMTTGEIAEALEIPPGTARTRLMRARELLRAKMSEIAADPPLVESTLAALERWAADLRALRDPEQ